MNRNDQILNEHHKPVYRDPATGFPDTPSPYDWDQAGEVARMAVTVMQTMIKVWCDEIEAGEKDWDLKKIRTAQGVGIVLEGMLYSFQTHLHAYGAPCDEGAQTSAYYYLEDF